MKRVLGTALAYFIVGRLSLLLAVPPGLASPIWPAAGLAVAAAARWRRDGLFGVFLGSVLCNASILWGGHGPAAALGLACVIAAGSTAQAWVAAFLIWRLETTSIGLFRSARGVLALSAGVGAATTIAAAIGAGVARAADPGANMSLNFMTWWLGDMLGIMLTTPVLLGRAPNLSPRRGTVFAAAAAASALASWPVFFSKDGGLVHAPYPSFIAMVVAAALLGRAGTLACAWALVVVSLRGLAMGLGPFDDAAHPLASLQGFLNAVVLTGLTLAGAIERQREVEAELERANASLEARVRERTEELQNAVTALKRSNQDLEQFAHAASHDLKEPLRKIGSFLELLERDYGGKLGDRAKEWILHAVSGAHRLGALIDDLLAYSRVGRADEPAQRVALERVLTAVLGDLDQAIREAGAIVEVGELPVVSGVPPQMRQLLQNLVSNAVKFRGERSPRVRIGATRDGPWWIITVADNGIGIHPAYFESIFGMFKRLHPASVYPGTGVGLALVKRIVERHGGTIGVSSVPGEGSTFSIRLPAEV